MLHTLTIRNLALIEHAEVSFAEGLNVISGETGGGKSLLIAALELLRGGKARADMIRHGASELRVDGEFRLGTGERSRGVDAVVLDLAGVALEDDLLLITRSVDANGRSRSRVNGRPVTMAALRELGAWLLEIHGQGDSRGLMRPEIQCETLDAFAGTQQLRENFASALAEARRCRNKLQEVTGGERDRQSRIEFLRFQVTEMETLDLAPGEVQKLEQEHRILLHLDRMREYLETAIGALQDGETSASDLLALASRSLIQAAEIDRDLGEARELVSDAEVHIVEACRSIQSGLGRLELDPLRMAMVEERLAELRGGLSRFGPTEADFSERLAQARDELDSLGEDGASPAALQRELTDKVDALDKLARKLVRARRKASGPFVAAVEAELGGLGMAQTKLSVSMDEKFEAEQLLDGATGHGPTAVDFTVRVNPGEPEKSMRETASGGEMARIVIAIKKCLADQDRVPFLVFDEVDAEIGGRLGFEVGAKLADVSENHQVLIVTHLPQVAAFADRHFKVEKTVREGRTITGVVPLADVTVEQELAAMTVGEGVDAEAIAEARRMVKKARRRS